MRITIVSLIVTFLLTIGYFTYKILQSEVKYQQSQQQKMIEANPDIARFYK